MLRNCPDKTSRYDPISLDDIDDTNEWLTGVMEDDLVHDGDEDLTWTMVEEASGAGEALRRTRSSHPSSSRPSSSRPSSYVSLIDEDTDEEQDDTFDDDGIA